MKNVWRKFLAQNALQEPMQDGKEEKLGNTATLVISSSAKIFAGTVTYPYQVIRSRLQTYHSEKLYGKGIIGVGTKIWREEGEAQMHGQFHRKNLRQAARYFVMIPTSF